MGVKIKITTIFLGIIAIAAAIFIAVLISGSKAELTKSFSKQCKYDGKNYKIGADFQSTDGCNMCKCGANGEVSCTLMACD